MSVFLLFVLSVATIALISSIGVIVFLRATFPALPKKDFPSFWNRIFSNFGPAWKSTTDLGKVMLRMGIVDEKTLAEAAKEQLESQRKMIGEILVERGHITRVQLQSALHTQMLMRRGKHADAMLDLVNQRTTELKEYLLGNK